MRLHRRGFFAQAAAWPLLNAAAAQTPYQGSTAEQPLNLVNLHDLEPDAAKILPPGPFGYIAGGAGDEWTLHENRRAFDERLNEEWQRAQRNGTAVGLIMLDVAP